ncbi:putative uncharacterized protein [Prevotella sp. CAG:255]|uniref:hypothetical protein n=1 Tax=Prevotella sp. CAG:255 TaxID=1262923 RepID=UPI00033C61FF|nr:hypothetical protein [Prevotella sp. CAG:255]CCX70290.1 putative uncharacterized protein [Prevotella sp. CAG:255]
MDYRQKTNRGEYIPAFFEMYLKIDGEIDLNKLSKRDFSLFFHEYIHFLQDITTTYGLTTCYAYGEYIQSVVNDIYEKKQKEFYVPYIYNDNKDNIRLNEQLQSLTLGDWDTNIESLDNIKVTLDDFELDFGKEQNIPSIKVVCIQANEDDYISFGASAIKESIAYIMERYCFEEYEKSCDFPYSSAEKVANAIYTEFGQSTLNVLALADCSLMFSNPGYVFVHMLYQFKKKHYNPEKPQDIYSQLENAKVNNGTKIFDFFENIANQTRRKIKSYFMVPDYPELHKVFHDWVDTVIDKALNLRKENPSYLLDIIAENINSSNNIFIEIVNSLGTPMMKNKQKDYFTIKPKGKAGWGVEVLKSVHQIYKILHDGEFQCSLYPWCLRSYEEHPEGNLNPTREKCLTKPWVRASEEELCPLGLLWKNWNLVNYYPKRKVE